MENLHGIVLKSEDMKKEGSEILYFKQLHESLKSQNGGNAQAAVLNESLFEKYDYLLVTAENELLGVKNEVSEVIFKDKNVYKLAQGMFTSG